MVAFQEAKRCSECEERDASRLCDYCGDKFCAQCWPVVHDAGRQHHTYVTVNKPNVRTACRNLRSATASSAIF